MNLAKSDLAFFLGSKTLAEDFATSMFRLKLSDPLATIVNFSPLKVPLTFNLPSNSKAFILLLSSILLFFARDVNASKSLMFLTSFPFLSKIE